MALRLHFLVGMMMLAAEEIQAGIERKYPAVDQDLRYELTLAAEMQSHLLPPASASAARLGLGARTVPARGVGGDWDGLGLTEKGLCQCCRQR